jgi:hypothetical protein
MSNIILYIIIVVSFIYVLSTLYNKNNQSNIKKQFEDYITKFGYYQYKKTHEEYNKRFEIFKNNILKKEIDKKAFRTLLGTQNFRTDITQFSGWTEDEYLSLFQDTDQLCEKYDLEPVLAAQINNIIIPEEYKESFNWATSQNPYKKPCLSKTIRNQGQCGSCWAFSFTGILEFILYINSLTNPSDIYNSLVDLSVQQIIDCTSKPEDDKNPNLDWCQGCNGGSGFKVCDKYLNTEKYICTEQVRPLIVFRNLTEAAKYYPGCSPCNETGNGADGKPKSYLVPEIEYIKISAPENDVKKILYYFGPLDIAIYCAAFKSFSGYTYGIYDSNPSVYIASKTFSELIGIKKKCIVHKIHAVILCGWGKFNLLDGSTQECWIIKNSWGDTGWSSNNSGQFSKGFVYFPMNYNTNADKSIKEEDKKHGYTSFCKEMYAFKIKRPECEDNNKFVILIKSLPTNKKNNESICTIFIKGQMEKTSTLLINLSTLNKEIKDKYIDNSGNLIDNNKNIVSSHYYDPVSEKFDCTLELIINETIQEDTIITLTCSPINDTSVLLMKNIDWFKNIIKKYDINTRILEVNIGITDDNSIPIIKIGYNIISNTGYRFVEQLFNEVKLGDNNKELTLPVLKINEKINDIYLLNNMGNRVSNYWYL